MDASDTSPSVSAQTQLLLTAGAAEAPPARGEGSELLRVYRSEAALGAAVNGTNGRGHTSIPAGGGTTDRVRVDGKLFRCGAEKWYARGVTYGPFRPQGRWHLPPVAQVERDCVLMRELGANVFRVYHPPPEWLLDSALRHGLRVLIDVPWDKHRCFLEDWSAQRRALARVRRVARQLGGHPAVFAISVANEIPTDVVRFNGPKRVCRFVDQLMEAVKEQSADCLTTYTNYPSTEFLDPRWSDFYCANVYLNDPETLGRYLDRLQHVAGSRPLVLGEYGLDSLRHGETEQARVLGQHVREVFRRGLAGSFVFALTDEWHTGGAEITDWAFGITDRARREKPAAQALRRIWAEAPCIDRAALPTASVVVASYNGGATLRECLSSLRRLDYPRYEVILVDDGSTDDTRAIAGDFPEVRYLHHENRGLSAARNTGLEAASGEIIAYTDSDCVADESWLLYLVQSMLDQELDAIGGPNVTPPSDAWTAKCVAASPGNPSHVMFDDQHAEHIPGCNMAFRREVLRRLGGFDAQFRQAGDDVDVCWRLLDAGCAIGYSPSALVWHHRRHTVRAYCRQQQGYGRSEAMLQFKHPQRFNALSCSRWNGIIYGSGAAGLPVAQPVIYHGRFGAALFQRVYHRNEFSAAVYFTMLEWHVLALLALVFGMFFPPFALVAGMMWLGTLAAVVHAGWRAELPSGAPRWCRPLIAGLYAIQPVVRALSRYRRRFALKRLPEVAPVNPAAVGDIKRCGLSRCDFFWTSDDGLGREALLEELVSEAQRRGWRGDYHIAWLPKDLDLIGDFWHRMRLCSATEVLGARRRFTRLRCEFALSNSACGLLAVVLMFGGTAGASGFVGRAVVGAVVALVLSGAAVRSRWRCLRSVSALIWNAGERAGLTPVRTVDPQRTAIEPNRRIREDTENEPEIACEPSAIS